MNLFATRQRMFHGPACQALLHVEQRAGHEFRSRVQLQDTGIAGHGLFRGRSDCRMAMPRW